MIYPLITLFNETELNDGSELYGGSELPGGSDIPVDNDLPYMNSTNKNNQKTSPSSDGSECEYSLNFEFQADIQWSSSLFTHLFFP